MVSVETISLYQDIIYSLSLLITNLYILKVFSLLFNNVIAIYILLFESTIIFLNVLISPIVKSSDEFNIKSSSLMNINISYNNITTIIYCNTIWSIITNII